MSHRKALSVSWYEIVKYNTKTRVDIEVLPGQIEGLRKVNQKIKILNASIKVGNNNQNSEIIYYRRRIGDK